LISGTASSMTTLICGRALQGLGSGLTTVALYVVVARTYPETLRPRVFSAYAAAWVLPALVGPAIAGFLVVQVGWRWVFLSVPLIAVIAAVTGWAPCRRLRRPPGDAAALPADGPMGLKKIGFAAIAGAAATILSVAGQHRPTAAIPLLGIAVGLLVWAVPHLLPRGTYRVARGLPTVILLRGLVSAAFVAAEVFLPLLLSRERGLSPTEAGLVLTVGALGWSAGSALQGRVSSRARRPALLQLGFGLLALGIVLASACVWHPVPLLSVYPAWAVAGLGIGIAYPTLSVLTLELSAPTEEGNNTSALQVNDALLQAITLALSGTVFAALVERSHVAPYLAGFAIAAAAAGAGALLAPRVRSTT
jgi:MFS family permease